MSLAVFPRHVSVDLDGAPRVAAEWYFYQSGTTTPIPVYTTAALSVQHPSPVVSVSNGYFPAVFIDSSVYQTHKQVLKDAAGVTLFTQDNLPSDSDGLRADLASTVAGDSGAELVGYRREESGASATTLVEILSRTIAFKDFGAVGDDSTDNASPFANALLAVQNGDEVILHTGTYRTSAPLTLAGAGITVKGQGSWKSVIKYTGAANSIIKMGTVASANSYINVLDLAVLANNASDILIDFKSVSFGVLERCRLWGGTSFATKKAIGYRLSAASNSCYQNIIQNCDVQYCSEGVAVEDGANENRILGGAIQSCGDGIKTRGTLSDSLRVAFVRFENNTDAIDIHDFQDYLIIGNRFEKNADGTRGVVVAGGLTTLKPLTLIQNHYSSYGAGNDLVLSGLVGRVEQIGENPNQYTEFTGRGIKHLGLGTLAIGTPDAAGAGIITVESSDTNANLTLTPKGTGYVAPTTYFHSTLYSLVDGTTAPSTISGQAQMYVDTADGDLKIKFGDGTVKTIVVDT